MVNLRATLELSVEKLYFLLILLLVGFSCPEASGAGCDVQYLKEPPSAIQCNPYTADARLKIQCQVQVPASVGSRVEILWFFSNTSQVTLQITDSSFLPLSGVVNRTVVDGDMWKLTSNITFNGANMISPTHRGTYFCQVVLDNIESLTSSNTLLVEEESDEVFNFHPCVELQVQDTMRCAGNISSSTTSIPDRETTIVPPQLGTSPPSSTNSTTITTDIIGTGITTDQLEGGTTLSLWVYVLVAVAAVFGIIIVVLTILCVGLCLKKNKTTDSFKQKTPELRQFTTNSMVTNGLYQHKDDNVMSGTHLSSHSQISDYNTLGERDYEVVDVNDKAMGKRDYNHLHRPSPPMLPNGRNGTFVFASSKEFHSMSTLTSQVGSKANNKGAAQGVGPGQGATVQQGVMSPAGNVFFPAKSASVGPEDHVYRELEQKALGYDNPRRTSAPQSCAATNAATLPSIYRSPTDSAPPDSAHSINRERGFMPLGIDAIDEGNFHEALYFPPPQTTPPLATAQCNRIKQGGLENKPETGNVFSEPRNPAAFPVHNYEKISAEPEYETPIITRKKVTPSASQPPVVSRPSMVSMRGRSDSGVRYETELTQSLKENTNHYSKLVRNSGDRGSKEESFLPSNSETSFSNLRQASLYNDNGGTADVNPNTVVEGGLTFTADQGNIANNSFNSTAFENPTSVSARGSYQEDALEFPGSLIYRPQSGSSATDSLSSYINRLQEEVEEDEPMRDAFLDEIVGVDGMLPEGVNTSLSRDGQRPTDLQRRSASEERCEQDSRLSSGSVYSRLSGHGVGIAEERTRLQSMPPKMCRDVQTNRLAEYTRLKTIV